MATATPAKNKTKEKVKKRLDNFMECKKFVVSAICT